MLRTTPPAPDSPSAVDCLSAEPRLDHRDPEQLLSLLYDELRRLARSRMSMLAPGQTLDPTEVVHESYLRITRSQGTSFEGRRHFFFAASRAIHDIMVERARCKSSLKRGGDFWRVDLGDWIGTTPATTEDLVDLGRAMDALRTRQPDHARIVDLRYFGGLTLSEIADVTGFSLATVKRRWSYARAWLRRELRSTAMPVE